MMKRRAEFLSMEWPAEDTEPVPQCPVCESTGRDLMHAGLRDRTFLCAPGSWDLYRCRECTAAYLDPRPTPATIGRAYAQYYTHGDTKWEGADSNGSMLRRIRKSLFDGYVNWKYGYRLPSALAIGALFVPIFPVRQSHLDLEVRRLKRPPNGGRLLDVGCGNGEWIRYMRDLGWQVVGQDVDPKAVQQAAQDGLDVRAGDLESLGLEPESFDAITLSHVIEHLHDPVACLRTCYRLLKPDGLIWLATPNIDSDSYKQFGASWRGLETPRHLVLFNVASLRRACEQACFHVQDVHGVICAEFLYAQSLAISEERDPNVHKDLPPHKWHDFRKEDELGIAVPARAGIITMSATKRPA